MTIPEHIRRFAERAEELIVEPLPPMKRLRLPTFTLALGPSPAVSQVLSVNTTDEGLDETIAQARRQIAEAHYTRTIWTVGPSCRPTDLVTKLRERGFVPATRPPFEPELTAMALVQPPPTAAEGVDVHFVRNFDEYLMILRIAAETFAQSEEDVAGWRAAAPELWKQQDGVNWFAYIAYLNGEPAGFAFAASGEFGLFLAGSGVRSVARGHGVYRTLVAARWAAAVRLGKPSLVIQAGAMSRPILERCGFQTVCHLDNLDDLAVGR